MGGAFFHRNGGSKKLCRICSHDLGMDGVIPTVRPLHS
jgi:hypothetical protein